MTATAADDMSSSLGGTSQDNMDVNGPRFTIKPPSTLKDDGKPSSSLKQDFDRLLRLIEDERHLCALTLLESIETRVNSHSNNNNNPPTSASTAARTSPTRHKNNHHHFNLHLPFHKRKTTAQQKAIVGPEAEKADVKAKLEVHKELLDKLKVSLLCIYAYLCISILMQLLHFLLNLFIYL